MEEEEKKRKIILVDQLCFNCLVNIYVSGFGPCSDLVFSWYIEVHFDLTINVKFINFCSYIFISYLLEWEDLLYLPYCTYLYIYYLYIYKDELLSVETVLAHKRKNT